MTRADTSGDAVSFYSQFLGEFLLSAASVSAFPFTSLFTSTGMAIWATIGLAGLVFGLVTVRVACRKNRLAEHAAKKTSFGTGAQPASVLASSPVYADEVTQAA